MPRKKKIKKDDVLLFEEDKIPAFIEELLGYLIVEMNDENITSLEVRNDGQVKIHRNVNITTYVDGAQT